MRRYQLTLLLVLLASSLPATASPTVIDPDVVHACQALFHGHRITSFKSPEQMRERQKMEEQAYRRMADSLARMEQDDRSKLLNSYREQLRPGSDARTAVAYTAAWYGGVDSRLLGEITQPLRNMGPHEEYVDSRYDPPSNSTIAYIPEALIRLYRRHPSNGILDAYFHIIRDGEMGTICESTDPRFAMEYPEKITRFLARAGYGDRSQIGTAVGIYVYAGERPKQAAPFLASMRKLASGPDRLAAKLGRRYIQQMEDARRRYSQ